ncbi:phosphoribosyl 1,2-cyclic phosphodiesterase [Rhodoligotrophos appendicifer]|uniref:MBL fold metallo-hydrolase n=1 Tax=Rhodoligotrophos appendicifer TaxID=987056 RepID=UPI00118592FB|nr:MBL fold metallo-hydrolase [Rhodoligotrophos appendicifer]
MNNDRFQVKFWGVRGSIACAGGAYDTYGGNTPCVEMLLGDHVLIFDAGSGARQLGSQLLKEGVKSFDLFFSHCHYDHIEGIPFFDPLYVPTEQITVWSGHHVDGGSTLDMLKSFMQAPFFPVGPEVFRAKLDYRNFNAGEVLEPAPGIRIETTRLRHCNGSIGFRIEYAGKSVCYVTDTEHHQDKLDTDIVSLIQDADIVIYDAMYTPEEYPTFKGFGHSTWEEGVALCRTAKAKKLVLFHHNPRHDDKKLAEIEAAAAAALPGTIAAREGLVLDV